ARLRAGIERVELVVASPIYWDEVRRETHTVPVGEDSCRGHHS
ncbi:MAG: hypothetical protein US77_C0008G0012, partial [Microgenomates group bacterium GW2011_GWC1_38_14]